MSYGNNVIAQIGADLWVELYPAPVQQIQITQITQTQQDDSTADGSESGSDTENSDTSAADNVQVAPYNTLQQSTLAINPDVQQQP